MGENKGVGAALTAPDHIDGTGGAEDMTTPISKRTTSPSFQFYPSDFLASAKVDEMSMTERGAYITLLSRAWLDNGLSTDLKQLARYVRMKPNQFERMWKGGPLGRCFEERGGRFFSPRQERERKKQTEYRRRQSDNGRLGGRPTRNPTPNPEEPKPLAEETHSKACAKRREVTNGDVTDISLEGGLGETPMDVWLLELQNQLYPPHRVTRNARTMHAFVDAMSGFPGGPSSAWAQLRANLAANVGSHEWRVRGMIPALEKYLEAGLWQNVLPATAPAAEQLAPRTNRTLQAAANIMREQP